MQQIPVGSKPLPASTTKYALAKRLGLSPTHVGLVLKGKRPSDSLLKTIATFAPHLLEQNSPRHIIEQYAPHLID